MNEILWSALAGGGVAAALCIPLAVAYLIGYKKGLDNGVEIGRDVWRKP